MSAKPNYRIYRVPSGESSAATEVSTYITTTTTGDSLSISVLQTDFLQDHYEANKKLICFCDRRNVFCPKFRVYLISYNHVLTTETQQRQQGDI